MAANDLISSVGITPNHPLFDTSFTLHRLSPLYHGTAQSILDNVTLLAQHARRFEDILKGEVLRGVHVGLIGSAEGLGKVGSLIECRWTVLEDEETWARTRRRRNRGQSEEGSAELARGLHIELQYERAEYTALLLRSLDVRSGRVRADGEGFTSFPLLMTRMPNVLRERLVDFLSATFDMRCSALRLSSSFLTDSLEGYLQSLAGLTFPASRIEGTTDHAQPAAARSIKDINVTLGFPAPVAPSLKSLDITIPGVDVSGFLEEGRRQLGLEEGRSDGQARALAVENSEGRQPIFTTALSAYTSAHLAMPLSIPSTSDPSTLHSKRDPQIEPDPASIHVNKIACGGFVLSSEGKVKIFSPPPLPVASRRSDQNPDSDEEEEDDDDVQRRAAMRLVGDLIARAEGGLATMSTTRDEEVDR